MDFRVKKLILEEGMKNIAETEGMKLEMNFDDLEKTITVFFHVPLQRYTGGVRKTCSYANLENACVDVFKTIEELRREVKDMKKSNRVSNSEFAEYANADIANTLGLPSILHGDMRRKSSKIPKIKNVIFNYPATIVFWADGDKTVVKCQNGDMFDAEKGLAMAIIKKLNGGKGNYCEIFKPWIKKYDEKERETLERVLLGIAEKWPTGFEYLVPQGAIDAQKDLKDILEGKVDPMMIKADENKEEISEPLKDVVATFKSSVSTYHTCNTCKHGDLDFNDEPCKECLKECAPGNSTPKWEPKE